MTQPVVLIDASIWLFRAHFSLPDTLRDDAGRPAAALSGWCGVLLDELARLPDALGVAFDEALFTGFRHRLWDGYKADRALPDEDLAHQLTMARAFTEALGVDVAASKEFEADDLLATAAERARAAGRAVAIVSRDKDLLQCLRGADDVMRGADGVVLADRARARERFGVAPEHVPDVQGLSGDAVDGIPGVSGIGAKTARALLERHGTLESLFEALDTDGEAALAGLRGATRLASTLQAERASAFLFRTLARARTDANVAFAPHESPPPRPSVDRCREALAEVGLGGRLIARVKRYEDARRAAAL